MTTPVSTWLDAFFGTLAGPPLPVAATLVYANPPYATWALVQPDEVVTFAFSPPVGLTFEFTTAGTGFSTGHPVTFQRPTGASYLIQNPQDPNNVAGGHAPAASVTGTTENTTYRFRFDGTLYRSVP